MKQSRFISFASIAHSMADVNRFDKAIWFKQMCDRCLMGIVHCLEDEGRIAYIFRDVAGLPYDEIAGILGRDPAAMRQMVSRSRRKLKHFLEDECALQNPDGKCACRMKRWVTIESSPWN